MSFKTLISGSAVLLAATAGLVGMAQADNDDLECTTADKASWLSEETTKDLLLSQGYKQVREIEVTDGQCYEVYAVDAQGEKVELYLDPTDGHLVAKED